MDDDDDDDDDNGCFIQIIRIFVVAQWDEWVLSENESLWRVGT